MKRLTAPAAVIAVLIYVSMWIGWVQHWGWLAAVDERFVDGGYGNAVRHPLWVPVWNALCTVFGPMAFRVVALLLIVWLFIRRYRQSALFLFISIELSGVVTEVAKRLADRPRPETQMVHAYGTSFPSGHALGVTVGVLALLTVVRPFVASGWRAMFAILGGFVIVAVGIGRVALHVHYPSDVLGGWALGYLYYLLCVCLLRPTDERQAVSGRAQ